MAFPKQIRKTDPALLESIRRMPCAICGQAPMSDPSHIRTRGSGGPDEPWNVFPKCRKHHIEWGGSWSSFLKKYPLFMWRLQKAGWVIEGDRLWHDGLKQAGVSEVFDGEGLVDPASVLDDA